MSQGVLRWAAEAVEAALAEGVASWPQPVGIRVGALASGDAPARRLDVVYHAVTLNENGAQARPQRAPREGAAGETDSWVFHPPVVPLTLHVLISPAAPQVPEALELVGRVVQIFQERPRIGAPGEGAGEQFALSHDARLSPERILDIFTAFETPPRPALAYLLRAELRSEKVVREAKATRPQRPRRP